MRKKEEAWQQAAAQTECRAWWHSPNETLSYHRCVVPPNHNTLHLCRCGAMTEVASVPAISHVNLAGVDIRQPTPAELRRDAFRVFWYALTRTLFQWLVFVTGCWILYVMISIAVALGWKIFR